MYLPPHFREDDLGTQHDLIRSYPLGLLVCVSGSGLLANPIPFAIDATAGDKGTLRCHVARSNPVWQDLQNAAECLVVFQGPQAYVTPSWYPSKREHGRVVPTWNYATVHCWGRPQVIEDAAWLASQINALTFEQERMRAEPWAVGDAPEPFIAAQVRGIIGIEIEITRIEGKWKMSQNRSAEDREGVRAGLLREEPAAIEIAELITGPGEQSGRAL